MNKELKLICYKGREVEGKIHDIARLRIEIFAEYPFLYQGDVLYEEKYLSKFKTIENGIVICAFEDKKLIGVSTGFPMIFDSLSSVLKNHNKNPNDYFCFGESVLKKEYRGQGIGNAFLQMREAHAKSFGCYEYICFYTIERPADDPRKPKDYESLQSFWKKRGFIEHKEIKGEISYQEIGEDCETPKTMVFWIKKI